MARFLLLMAAVTVLSGEGCARELPLSLTVDSGFLPYERQIIARAFWTVNEQLGRSDLGEDPILIDLGVEPEATSVPFDITKLADGKHVLYKIAAPFPEYGEAANEGCVSPCTAVGFATFGDVLIFSFIIGFITADDYLHLLLHEFGHFLGMGHSADPQAVMHPGGRAVSCALRPGGPVRYAPDDIRQFCDLYDCIR